MVPSGAEPSPGGADMGGSASLGDEKAARSVGIPPGTSAAPSSSFSFRWMLRWSCRRLDRLARELRREGWWTVARYNQDPPVLHVVPPDAPKVGDSIMVVKGPVFWWYQSSTGAWLGPCYEPWRAAESVTALMRMWGLTVGGRWDSS